MKTEPTKSRSTQVGLLEHLGKYRSNDSAAFLELAWTLAQWIGSMALYSWGILPAFLFVLSEALTLLHIFMIYHDLGHNSFFSKSDWNLVGEWIISCIVWTPPDWSFKHKVHHGDSGDLSKGPTKWSDTVYFTTNEYLALSPFKRKMYRFFRDPVIFFTCVPFLNWFVRYRIPYARESPWPVRTFIASVSNTIGAYIITSTIKAVFGADAMSLYLTGLYLTAIFGMILFHFQHAYNPPYVVRSGWNLKDSAILGSSLLPIPIFLKPWTMGIEYHHIHHYSTKVPGYLLRQCHEDAPEELWKGVTTLTVKEMWNSLFYTLYDEKKGKFVSFSEVNVK